MRPSARAHSSANRTRRRRTHGWCRVVQSSARYAALHTRTATRHLALQGDWYPCFSPGRVEWCAARLLCVQLRAMPCIDVTARRCSPRGATLPEQGHRTAHGSREARPMTPSNTAGSKKEERRARVVVISRSGRRPCWSVPQHMAQDLKVYSTPRCPLVPAHCARSRNVCVWAHVSRGTGTCGRK